MATKRSLGEFIYLDGNGDLDCKEPPSKIRKTDSQGLRVWEFNVYGINHKFTSSVGSRLGYLNFSWKKVVSTHFVFGDKKYTFEEFYKNKNRDNIIKFLHS